MSRFSFNWSAQAIAELRRRWAAGETALQIAAALGQGVSRSAVLGKIHRLGLSRPHKVPVAKTISPTKEPRVMRPVKRVQKIARKTMTAIAAIPVERFVPCPEPMAIVIPMCEPVTFAGLEAHMCRWPLGDPKDEGFGFCGAQKREGGSYCSSHHALCYSKSVIGK